MIELMSARDGDKVFASYTSQLQANMMEAGWRARTALRPARLTVVCSAFRMGRCSIADWDDRAAPRDESYREDVETARRCEPAR